MEKRKPPKLRCKTEIEGDVVSNLPKHVIDEILSRMPIWDAVGTSALSRNWRYKWATMPHLVFDDEFMSFISAEDKTSKLIDIVDHVLLLHNGLIHKFELSYSDHLGANNIDRWIFHISKKSIKELTLETWEEKRYKVPSCLFYCQDLIHLGLFGCLLKPPPMFKGFKNLKCLDLRNIALSQDVFDNLIANCPMLERLRLFNLKRVSRLNIDAPNLRFIDIRGDYDDVRLKNTFHLTEVAVALYNAVESEQTLDAESSSQLLNFFVHLPNIRSIEIQNKFLMYLAIGNIPDRLPHLCADLTNICLKINFHNFEEVLVALCLFRSCPNLRVLHVGARLVADLDKGTDTDFWNVGEHNNSMFATLRLVNITNISGRTSELGFISFLLSNSPVLEKMTIRPFSDSGRCELLKELVALQRASSSAKIIYLDPLTLSVGFN